MQKLIFVLVLITSFSSCAKKYTYQCETVHDAGGFLGVQSYTVDKTFKGTPAQKDQFEANNTNEKKTTTCYQ